MTVAIRPEVYCREECIVSQRLDRDRLDFFRAARPRGLAQGRQDYATLGPGQRRRQCRVFGRLGPSGEVHIERDGANAGLVQPVDSGGVDAARPGPAVELRQAPPVNLDDVNFAARRVRAERVADITQEAIQPCPGPGHQSHHAEEQRRPDKQPPPP